MNPDWRVFARCREPGAPDMYPVDGDGARLAQLWCAGCPVRVQCSDAGLREPYGVWGGLSERHRARIRRSRGLAALTYSEALVRIATVPEEGDEDDHEDEDDGTGW